MVARYCHSHRLYCCFAINRSRTSSGSATEISSPTKRSHSTVAEDKEKTATAHTADGPVVFHNPSLQ